MFAIWHYVLCIYSLKISVSEWQFHKTNMLAMRGKSSRLTRHTEQLHIKCNFFFLTLKRPGSWKNGWVPCHVFIYPEVELKYRAKGGKCTFLCYCRKKTCFYEQSKQKHSTTLSQLFFSSLCAHFYSNCSPTQQEVPMTSCSDVSNGGQCSVKMVNVALLFLLGHYLERVDAVLLYSFQGLFFFLTCSTFCHRPHRRTLSSGCTITGSPLSQGSSPASQVTTRMLHIQGWVLYVQADVGGVIQIRRADFWGPEVHE